MAHQDELDAAIDERCRQLDADDVVQRCVAADVLVAPIQGVAEVVADPQVRHNGMVVTTQHDKLGPVDVTGVPIHFRGTPGSVRCAPPMKGQHTAEVLAELGYQTAEIAALLAGGGAADQ